MSKDEALRDLIERVERAEGPDRELDARICIALGFSRDNVMVGVDGWCINSATNPNPFRSPAYTGSIDAAMHLTDSRALWAHGSMEDGPFARLCWPQLDGTFTGGYVEANCATVPLSIVAASLRAHMRTGG